MVKPLSKYLHEVASNLRLAVPVALSQLGYVAVMIADNVMTGQFGGDDPVPLSAVAFGGTVSYLFYIFGVGITLGLTPLIGEMFASGRHKRMAGYFQSSIVLYAVVGVVAAVSQIAVCPLFYYLGQPEEVIDMAVPYYRLLAWSTAPMVLFGAFRQFLEGVGDTRTPMAILVATNMLNILLNWVFIFGHCGFDAMGVYGAGLATAISRVLNPVLAIILFLVRRDLRAVIGKFSRQIDMIADSQHLLRIGLLIAGQLVLEMMAFTLTGIMMGWFGKEAIGANQIAVTYGNCAYMISVALSSAATIRVSHCYGARDAQQMRTAIGSALSLAVVWGTIILVLYVALRNIMPLPFTTSEQVIQLSAHMLLIYAAYQVSDAIQCTLVGILRGLQDVQYIMRIAFFAYIIVNLPVGCLLAFPLGLGTDGLIGGYVVGLTVAAALYGMRLATIRNRKCSE